MNGHGIDFEGLAAELLPKSIELLKQWFPAGKLSAREYKIGNLAGDPGESLSVNIDTGLWADFSTNKTGKDLLALYAAIHGLTQTQAAKKLSNGHATAQEDIFAPSGKCEAFPRHKFGMPKASWEYTDTAGNLLFYVCRFEPLNEKKQFAPLTRWLKADGKPIWKWKKAPIDPQPYRIKEAIAKPEARILIVEGEKTADAAQKLLPDWIVVTWAGGSATVKQTDWSALKFRYCWCWPDADEPGDKAAKALKKILPDLHIVTLPEGTPEGWDLADAPNDFNIEAHLKPKPKSSLALISDRPAETTDQRNELTKPLLPFVMGNTANTCVTVNGYKYPGIDQKSIHNVMLLVENDEKLKDCLVYNIFADDVFFITCPPWEGKASFKPHPMREDEVLCFRAWVETRGLKCTKSDANDILLSMARRNIINPPHDYFESLEWDGKKRLDTWLKDYLGAKSQDKRYLALVGSKWMIAVVNRIYEPGCKFDNVLILEGDQYLGKSRALETIATVNGERYFTDEAIDFKNKDSLIILQGKLVIELAELASFKNAETQTIKGFLSRRIDEYRPLYMRKSLPRPRMFAIAGSVNPIAGYLTDPTGNRRYWPVLCQDKIHLDKLAKDRDQLWAEAVARYKKGERIWLLQDEHNLACIEQAGRVVEDLMTDKIIRKAKALCDESWPHHDFFISELVEKLDIPFERLDSKIRLRITDCLTAKGYEEYKPRQADGTQTRKWHLKIKEEEKPNQPELPENDPAEDWPRE